jgi:hypothetical protein
MATLTDVRRWNAAQLEQVAEQLRVRQQTLTSYGDEFTRVLPVAGWTGTAADAATDQHRTLTTWLDQAAGGVAVVGKALSQASDAIPALQHAIVNAQELAARYGFQVTDAGAVVDRYAGRPVPPELHPEDRARVQQEVAAGIIEALRTADDIDTDLAAVFQSARRGDQGAGSATVTAAAAAGAANPGLPLPPPPPGATPAQNAAWWASLSPAGQSILAHDHPDWLGNLDGLPATVRSTANLARLPALRAELQTQLAAATARHDPDAAQVLQTKLDSLKAVTDTMAKGNRQLLTLDTGPERVQAAVAVGNVDTAEHVAVFTPGLTSTVSGSLQDYDRNMADLQIRAQGIATRYGDHASVATVTWIGYQAPQLTLSSLTNPSSSVANDAAAAAGAAHLDGFLNGIGASHDIGGQPLHLTALGHSYGSLTTGIALHQQTPVHDAVVFGSPGIDTTNRAQLKVPQGHMYSEWAMGDPVPVLDKDFGTSPYPAMSWPSELQDVDQLSTGDAVSIDGQPLHRVYGHTDYLEQGSTSQYNMGVIVAGRPDLRIQ